MMRNFTHDVVDKVKQPVTDVEKCTLKYHAETKWSYSVPNASHHKSKEDMKCKSIIQLLCIKLPKRYANMRNTKLQTVQVFAKSAHKFEV